MRFVRFLVYGVWSFKKGRGRGGDKQPFFGGRGSSEQNKTTEVLMWWVRA